MTDIRLLERWANEDPDAMYGMLNYEDKVVLDIGAEYGSTASYFLYRGAAHVIAVEPDNVLFPKLLDYATETGKITPVQLFISSVKELEDIYQQFDFEIVKSDCEGCEIYLSELSDLLFCKPQAYIMETHNDEIWNVIRAKLLSNDYEVSVISEALNDPMHKDPYPTRTLPSSVDTAVLRIVYGKRGV